MFSIYQFRLESYITGLSFPAQSQEKNIYDFD